MHQSFKLSRKSHPTICKGYSVNVSPGVLLSCLLGGLAGLRLTHLDSAQQQRLLSSQRDLVTLPGLNCTEDVLTAAALETRQVSQCPMTFSRLLDVETLTGIMLNMLR